MSSKFWKGKLSYAQFSNFQIFHSNQRIRNREIRKIDSWSEKEEFDSSFFFRNIGFAGNFLAIFKRHRGRIFIESARGRAIRGDEQSGTRKSLAHRSFEINIKMQMGMEKTWQKRGRVGGPRS